MSNSYKKAMDKIELSDALKEKIIDNASSIKTNQASKLKSGSLKTIIGIAACFAFFFLAHYTVTNDSGKAPVNIASVNTPTPSLSEVSSKQIAVQEPVNKDVSESKKNEAHNNTKESTVISISAPEKAKRSDSENKIVKAEENIISENTEEKDIKNDAALSEEKIILENTLPAENNALPPFAKGKVAAEENNNDSEIVIQEKKPLKAPQKIPENYEISAVTSADDMLEITYTSENDTIIYTAAKTPENLSKANEASEFMEIVNIDNTDIILKGSEELYYNAVWLDNEDSFSITSDNGIEKSVMVDIVMSVDYTIQNNTDN